MLVVLFYCHGAVMQRVELLLEILMESQDPKTCLLDEAYSKVSDEEFKAFCKYCAESEVFKKSNPIGDIPFDEVIIHNITAFPRNLCDAYACITGMMINKAIHDDTMDFEDKIAYIEARVEEIKRSRDILEPIYGEAIIFDRVGFEVKRGCRREN